MIYLQTNKTRSALRRSARSLRVAVLLLVFAAMTQATEEPIEAGTPSEADFEGSLAPLDWNEAAAHPGLTDSVDPEDTAIDRLPQAENIPLAAPTLTGEDEADLAITAHPNENNRNKPSPLILLGSRVPPNTTTRLSWSPSNNFEGIAVPTPVLVVNGAKPGPRLCLTAAVHGDELNGIEVVRQVMYRMKPDNLSGAVIGVPIVNLQGFRRSSRYLPDRRDLNRFFPGNPYGSSASRIAYSLFQEIVMHCDALVDLHTGSFYRANLPQLRADLNNPKVEELAHAFSSLVVMHSKPANGTLRRAATEAGIPTVTLEAGEPMRFQEAEVSAGVEGVWSLLNSMGMYPNAYASDEPQPVYYRSKWLRVNKGGILFSEVDLGHHVSTGQLLGTVTDPITNVQQEIHSPFSGRILGMALDQFVMPGFAAYRIGLEPEDKPKAPNEVGVLGDTPASAQPVPSAGVSIADDQQVNLETSE